MIAALFVETGGCYFGLDGVDPWDVTRDAQNVATPIAFRDVLLEIVRGSQ